MRWHIEATAGAAAELAVARRHVDCLNGPTAHAQAEVSRAEAALAQARANGALLARRLERLHTAIRVFDGALDPTAILVLPAVRRQRGA